MRIHNCIAWQNCERRNFPLSLFHPPLSLFSPPPFYFATHYSTLARICAPFYRYFKSSWNSINLSTLLIREEACARMHHRLVKVARSFLSIPSIPSCFERSILSILLSSPFFFFFFFFFLVFFFFLFFFFTFLFVRILCICACICAHVYVCMYACICVCVCACMCVSVYVCVCM